MPLVSLVILHLIHSIITPTLTQAKIDPAVLKQLTKDSTSNIIVQFDQDRVKEAVQNHKPSTRSSTSAKDFDDIPEKLIKIAQESQAQVQSYLASTPRFASIIDKGHDYQLWITNELAIPNADRELVDKLSQMPNVTYIRVDREISVDSKYSKARSADGTQDNWNIKMIKAPELWQIENITGKGIVIGMIDTGVDPTHQLIESNFRRDYNWYDANGDVPTPYDDHGHGTMVTCLAVGGSHQNKARGVAPGSEYIACKAFNSMGRSLDSIVTRCVQFMLCPTDSKGENRKCSKRPHVVNQSFGTDLDVISPAPLNLIFQAYAKAGILVVQAAGNSGECNHIFNEAAHPYPLTVGAVDRYNQIYRGSSQGPTKDGRIKPEVVAPGVDILSGALAGGLAVDEGTSFATPHVAGVAALLRSADPTLNQKQLLSLLTSTAQAEVTGDIACANTSYNQTPNNMIGYGIINAHAAYKKLMENKQAKTHTSLLDSPEISCENE